MWAAYVGYYSIFLIIFLGLAAICLNTNLVRRIVGLTLMQNGVVLFYVAMGFVLGGYPPILRTYRVDQIVYTYHAPLPHVLMLTAIVVGFATLAVGLSLVIRIKEAFGTVDARILD